MHLQSTAIREEPAAFVAPESNRVIHLYAIDMLMYAIECV